MPNILVMCADGIPSALIGVVEPLQYIQKQGELKVTFKKSLDIKKTDLAQCDILVCVRGSEQIEYRIVKACKDAGKFIAYYMDDDLLDIPSVVECAQYYNDNNIAENILNIIGISDILLAPNPKLLTKYQPYATKTALVKAPAMLLGLSRELEKKKDGLIRIGFAGGTDHANTLDAVAKGAILKIDKEYDKKVLFEFVGAKPPFLKELINANYVPYMSNPQQYREYMRVCSWDIGLAPLPKGEFFKHKYFNKFLEYGAIKVAGIYSNTEPFTFIVEHKVNGFLCENTDDAWYEAIKQLIEETLFRETLAMNAIKTLEEGYTLTAVGQDMINRVPEFIHFKAPKKKVKVYFLNKGFNQINIWAHKCYRIFKKNPLLGIFIIIILFLRKIVRKIKTKIGG